MMKKKQIEEMACRKDFVTAAVFPSGMTGEIGEGFRILEAAGRNDLFELLKKEFPGANVGFETLSSKKEDPGAQCCAKRVGRRPILEKGIFDYIAAVGLTYLPCDEGTDQLFRDLIACLKPGGVMSVHVCSFSGYYGAVMLGAVIRQLSRGKSQVDTIKIARAVIRELPETHPAFANEIFKPRDETAVKELLDLSAAIDHVDKLFTVSKLQESIPRWGGRFLQWVLPELYDLTQYFKSLEESIIRRLHGLPDQKRAAAAELLTASPSEHYFLIQKL